MLKYFVLILCLIICNKTLYSKDIREFEVGTSIKNIPEERYTNIRCLESQKVLKLWDDFSLCKKRNDDNFYLGFEYDDKYAFNENFEGTQIAGHPVTINIAINKKGIIEKITVNTDPNAPPYFKKQAHLFWMRVYSKYGSKDWKCNDIKKKESHKVINKKYTNRICTKSIKNKKITYHTEFYFLNSNKKKKENLISRTELIISYYNL
ncbi:MAG: hypothetical protein CMJ13_04120 [Pelagibacterales bacterium]|nr:hypothetical protein [Pelagibacterales bacterium]